ncbi:MAG TPA: VIT domain-containing protein, partial [Polyangiaceae bacterium]|nr:VIT domain-containing protein [Polyangiaceae bacterium]
MMTPMPAPHSTPSARLVPSDGKTLPLRGAAIVADARGGLARVRFEQRFENPHAEPLAVTYKLPLPADGAVGGFAFRIGDRRIVGRVEGKKAAREIFEQAVLDGKTAALLEEERSSLFTQELGNIPPGAEIVCEIEIDVPLKYLAEGAWELRFPLA